MEKRIEDPGTLRPRCRPPQSPLGKGGSQTRTRSVDAALVPQSRCNGALRYGAAYVGDFALADAGRARGSGDAAVGTGWGPAKCSPKNCRTRRAYSAD